jgi:hypothetical protein
MRGQLFSRARGVCLALAGAAACVATCVAPAGCAQQPKWGQELTLTLPGSRSQVWAVAPAVNLSGHREVDSLLQSDLLYQQLQEVRGVTVVPVDRVVEAYAALKIQKVQSPEQAALVCEAIGCDALVVPTVTAYDPYDPPKFGGALALFRRPPSAARQASNLDPRELARAAAPDPDGPPPDLKGNPDVAQAVGMFDATNGSVRDALFGYAQGRHDPVGPMGPRQYLLDMDRYTGFAYHTLIEQLLRSASGSARGASARGPSPKADAG